ncbi:MAG: phosphoglycerate dehydrogenase [Xanthomonadales bacterium]|nr:phosphoglycerate dehydrogenase [Xanthomonadales bacterium]
MSSLSLAKDKIRILLLEGLHPRAAEVFSRAGYENIRTEDKSLTGEELKQAIAEAHFIGIRSRTQLDREVLESARRLTAIGCFCIGTNQVDLDAAQGRGIPVFNAPFSNTRSVAELVLAEIIMLMRGIPQRNAAAHRGEWMKSAQGSYEIRGKKLGIVGYGHIGTQIGILAESLGMEVLFYDVVDKLPLGNAKPMDSLKELLGAADVVTLHVPQTAETRDLIDAAAIGAMREGTWLINASRGQVVVIDALVDGLKSGRLRGAAIDVFPEEPKSNQHVFNSPLVDLDNVLLTPHIGGSTQEAQKNIAQEVASKLVRYSDNGSTVSAVNFPEVAMPDHAGCHRILHIHRNEPGVLQQINKVFSHEHINIAAQYLQTLGEVGYVVMDIDCPDTGGIIKQLREIAGTIRSRVLY